MLIEDYKLDSTDCEYGLLTDIFAKMKNPWKMKGSGSFISCLISFFYTNTDRIPKKIQDCALSPCSSTKVSKTSLSMTIQSTL